MAILLLRHADAVDEGPDLGDEHRYLTAGGRAGALALGRELAAAGIAIDRIVTSPLVRAVQTAELVAVGLGLARVIEVDLSLAPGGSVRRAAAMLGEADGAGAAVLAVGHEPSISALGGMLVGEARPGPMRKAEACLVEGGVRRRWFGSDRR